MSLKSDDRTFRISNGVLSATIERSTAKVTSVTLAGRKLLGSGTGYWSMVARSGKFQVGSFGRPRDSVVSIDPASNDGERAEVVCRFEGAGSDGGFPGQCEVRYAIDRHSNTLYATAIMNHGEGDAPFRFAESRFAIKLDPEIFNQLMVDKDRSPIMPSSKDWIDGTQLNIKEVRRMNSGVRKGWAEHKYSYSAMLGEVPAYGWVGAKQGFGVWMINPSVEYIAGGPTKMELTGHLDVGGSAFPTLLNMWQGSHYGGTVLELGQDEKWSKVIGPFAVHFNQGANADDLLKSACKQASIERVAWPYVWLNHERYPTGKRRGGLSGKLLVDEVPAVNGGMWVGLTAPEYELFGKAVGWQRDGRNYQYWTKARKDGSFSLANVRPGTYVMHAFMDGILGEFERTNVTVRQGEVHSIGDIHWKPERAGPTLWEIGIPDRSAAEFKNGDQYWHWGNYLKFRSDFPNGVDYTVGKSDWRKDWHICQPLDLSPEGKVLGDSTWTVRFPLENVSAGGARLRISFCGSRLGSRLQLGMNGSDVGDIELPEDGTMHRDSHRGMWFERSFDIPAGKLKAGENILNFRLGGTAWHQGVLYDYIRMESLP